MSHGYIKIYRQLQDNKLWNEEKFTDGQAWIDMIMLANHKQGHIKKRGIRLTINRGELGYSELALAERWKWSRGKVRRYLKYLDAENMIKTVQQTVQQNKKLTTHIQIVNYEQFQGDGTTDGTTDGHETDMKRYRNKNDKKNKNDKNKNIQRKTRFIPPSISEITDYCNDRSNNVNPQQFHDFYQSKNWYVGKNKMTDWQAAIRTWERQPQRTTTDATEQTKINLKTWAEQQ